MSQIGKQWIANTINSISSTSLSSGSKN